MRRSTAFFPRALAAVLLPFAASHATVSIYVSPAGVSESAPFAFEARVVKSESGYDPVTARIATYVTLEVSRVFRGPLVPGRIVLRERGGAWGDLVHVAEGAPVYGAGETVVVFAEPSRDGALRTAGGFFGRFAEVPTPGKAAALERRLSGHGTILRAPAGAVERFARGEIERLASEEPRAAAPFGGAEPEELGRLIWNDDAEVRPEFVPLSPGSPARWDEADAGGTILLNVERAREPLGDPTASLAALGQAADAWTAVPEARVVVRLGNTDLRYTASAFASPADVYPGSNVILFGDPYDDLSDPVSCTGTVAYGGYWRAATPSRTVNGVLYYPIRRAYVIVNRGFECFLAAPDNLAEIATHEIGHGLGFGHSSAEGSIMRAWPYGGRGSVLGQDDRNAAHCVYPHSFVVVSPNGGETFRPGDVRTIRWSGTSDAGTGAGTVDLELSVDAGLTWTPVAAATDNDGSFEWTIPALSGTSARVRVVRRTVATTGAAAARVCSQDLSNGVFTILPPPAPAGTIAAGGAAPLILAKTPSGDVELTWGAPCGAPAGYAVYAGSLSLLREGGWDHAALRCGGAAERVAVTAGGGPDAYYLVASVAEGGEGSLGSGSDGKLRPEAATRCAARTTLRCP